MRGTGVDSWTKQAHDFFLSQIVRAKVGGNVCYVANVGAVINEVA